MWHTAHTTHRSAGPTGLFAGICRLREAPAILIRGTYRCGRQISQSRPREIDVQNQKSASGYSGSADRAGAVVRRHSTVTCVRRCGLLARDTIADLDRQICPARKCERPVALRPAGRQCPGIAGRNRLQHPSSESAPRDTISGLRCRAKKRRHTVVCGLGETGMQIVRNMQASGLDVVVIDRIDDTVNAATCDREGIPVIKGDATNPDVLRSAGTQNAKTIVVCMGDDTSNMDVALKIKDLVHDNAAQVWAAQSKLSRCAANGSTPDSSITTEMRSVQTISRFSYSTPTTMPPGFLSDPCGCLRGPKLSLAPLW